MPNRADQGLLSSLDIDISLGVVRLGKQFLKEVPHPEGEEIQQEQKSPHSLRKTILLSLVKA